MITKFVLIIGLKRVNKKFVNIDYSNLATIWTPGLYFIIALIVV
tara:strand:- start:1616 stop:1747 length:132 start_codon:yes stop_codon:yes gene_type:complete